MVKKLYSRLFQYIVDEVNYNLKDGNFKGDEFIGILDIFGFESLEVNSLNNYVLIMQMKHCKISLINIV